MKKLSAVIYILLLLLSFLSSCGSSKNTSAKRVNSYRNAGTSSEWTFGSGGKSAAIAETDLVKEAKTWLGTPYKYGGKSKNGTDCSGFIMEVYRKVTDIKLPRTTAQQKEYCQIIGQGDLKPGDLVFFSTSGGKKVSHVGMYVGAGQIIHASSSKGVIFSSLSDRYYARTYHSAGRVRKYRLKEFPPEPKESVLPESREEDLYKLLDEAVEQRVDSIYSQLID